jgi:uncharacterized membrane-anchored protein YhcB (DUF1043 family)
MPATSKIPAWAKGYVTIKRLVIVIVVVFALILVFAGWSIREIKQSNRNYNDLQKQMNELSNQQKEQIKRDAFVIDSLTKDYDKKSADRKDRVIVIQQKRDENVQKINSPDFNNDDIRKGFQSN